MFLRPFSPTAVPGEEQPHMTKKESAPAWKANGSGLGATKASTKISVSGRTAVINLSNETVRTSPPHVLNVWATLLKAQCVRFSTI